MTIMNDDLKGQAFYEFLLAAMKNVYAHLADGGALYVFHSDAEKVNFFNAVVHAGFHYSTTCIWVKNTLVIGRMDYQMDTRSSGARYIPSPSSIPKVVKKSSRFCSWILARSLEGACTSMVRFRFI